MDLTAYRNTALEQQRTADLLGLLPERFDHALDVGARDGFFSRLLSQRCGHVTALDLQRPQIDGERIECVAGDVTQLGFADATFDLVFCAEVLEHIPTPLLEQACTELVRVARRHLVIGVPYRQDLRFGRTTCAVCGQPNPPWGHVNRFDEQRLHALFAGCSVQRTSFVGSTSDATNAISTTLMDWAGNPYGTWSQDEPCVHCGAPIGAPRDRSLLQKVFTKAAFELMRLQRPLLRPRANWIHVLFEKEAAPAA